MNALIEELQRGGVVLALIAALSVLVVTLILWKVLRLWRLGAWGSGKTGHAVRLWAEGDRSAAVLLLRGARGLRGRVVEAAMRARMDPDLGEAAAREETTRIARAGFAEARRGLRALELIATIAPLLGLLGTVLGMIAAFQALETSGASADPAALAGGIWEALLTTAAGMAVAIPAQAALSWFDGTIARLEAETEDLATQVFVRAGGRR